MAFGLLLSFCKLCVGYVVFALLSREQATALACRRHPLMESAIYFACGLSVLLLRCLPDRFVQPQVSALKWLLERSVFRGCPSWYRPFASEVTAEQLDSCIDTWLVYLCTVSFIAAMPSTWRFPSRVVPPWLLFLDRNRDGKISRSEFVGSAGAMASKVLCAVLSTRVGQLIIRLKAPKPRELNFYLPMYVQDANDGTALFWRPLIRLIAMQRALRSGRQTWAHLVDKFLSVGIYMWMAAAWLNIFGFHLQTVLTIGGVASLAVALAAKTLAQNLISGVLIYTNKSVQPGLEVMLLNKKLSGIVDTVGWFHTEICLMDGTMVSVPNAEVFEGVVVDRSSKRTRVIDKEILVSKASPGQIREMVLRVGQMLVGNENIIQAEEMHQMKARYNGRLYIYPPQCVVSGMSDFGIKLRIRAYARKNLSGDQFIQLQSEVLLEAADWVTGLGGTIGIPAAAYGSAAALASSHAGASKEESQPAAERKPSVSLEDIAAWSQDKD